MSTVETNLLAQLDSVARRARRIRWAYGIGGFVFVVVAAVVLASLLDYGFSVRDIWTRRLLTACVWGMVVWAGFKFVWSAWRFRPTRFEIALRVERCFPQLRNRLSSAIAFMENEDDDSMGMSRLTIQQAGRQVLGLPVQQCLSTKVATQMVCWVLGSIVFTSAIAAMAPDETQIALRRLAFPSVRRHNLQWITAPSKVAEGQDAQFELVDKQGRDFPDDVWFEWVRRLPTRGVQTERRLMEKTADGSMRITLNNVLVPFRYRAYGGDDHSLPLRSLKVVPAGSIASSRLTIDPPKYTNIRPYSTQRTNVKALIGSRLSLTLVLSKAVRKAELVAAVGVFQHESAVQGRITKRGKTVRFESGDADLDQGDLLITGSGPMTLIITDSDGVTITLPVGKVVAVADQPPMIDVDWTVMRRILTSTAKIPVRIFATDDLATQDVSILLKSVGGLRRERSSSEAEDEAKDTDADNNNSGEGELGGLAAAEPQLDTFHFVEESIWQGPKEAAPQDWQRSRPPQKNVVVWTMDAEAEQLVEGDSFTVVFSATDYRGGRRECEPQLWTVVSASELDAMLRAQQAQAVEYLREATQRQIAASQRLHEALTSELTPGQAMDLAAVDGRNANQTLWQRVLPLLEDVLRSRMANGLQESATDHPLRETVSQLSEILGDDFPRFFEEMDQWARASAIEKPSHLAAAASNGKEIAADLLAMVEQIVVWNQQENAGDDIARVVHDQRELFNDTEQFRLDELSHDAKDTAERREALVQRQAALAERYERWLHDVEDLAARNPQSFADINDMAVDLGIGSRMRETVDDLRDDRLGDATRQQERLIDDLSDLATRLQPDGADGQGHESMDVEAFREAANILWRHQVEINKKTTQAERDSSDSIPLADAQHEIGTELHRMAQAFELHRAAMMTTAELALETADRLREGRLGTQIQADQKMIAESLEAMASEPEGDELPRENGTEEPAGQDSTDLPPEHGPTVEDWKVVQQWQQNVLDRTVLLQQSTVSGEQIDESARALANRQQQVSDLVRRLTTGNDSQNGDSVNKTQAAEGPGQEKSRDKARNGSSSTDQGDTLIDDLLNTNPAAGDGENVGDKSSGEEAGEQRTSQEEELLAQIVSRMDDVTNRLRVADVGAETQQLQNEILDKISEQLKRVRQRQDRSTNNREATGDSASRNGNVGDNGQGPRDAKIETLPEGLDLSKRTWAQLPARVRDQLRNAPASRFLPRFELRIEQYYERLSSQGEER